MSTPEMVAPKLTCEPSGWVKGVTLGVGTADGILMLSFQALIWSFVLCFEMLMSSKIFLTLKGQYRVYISFSTRHSFLLTHVIPSLSVV